MHPPPIMRLFLLPLLLGTLAFSTASAQTAKTPEQAARENEFRKAMASAESARKRGDLTAALADAKKAVTIARETFGDVSVPGVFAHRLLAEIHEGQDQFEPALAERQAVVDILAKLFSPRDHRTISARLSVAHCKQLAKLEPEQRQQLRENFRQGEKSEALFAQRKLKEATTLARKVYDERRELLGTDNLHTNNALAMLGRMLRAGPDHQDALPLLKQELAVWRRLEGEESPAYLATLHNLGQFYKGNRDYASAEPFLKQALAGNAKAGKNHDGYAACLEGLGTLYNYMGEFDRSEPLLLEAAELRKRLSGPNSMPYLMTQWYLVQLYESHERPARAVPILEETIPKRKKLQGENHPDVPILIGTLGLCQRRTANPAKAEAAYQEALELEKKYRGESVEYASLLRGLGRVYVDMAERRRAEPVLRRSVEILKKTATERPNIYALALVTLGDLYRQTGEFARAEALLQEARAIQSRKTGNHQPDSTDSEQALAQLYSTMGDFDRALPLMIRVVEMTERQKGETNSATGHSYGELGNLYMRMRRFAEAEKCMLRALASVRKYHGESDPATVHRLTQLAVLYHYQSQYDQARKLYEQALAQIKKGGRENTEQHAYVLHNLGMLYLCSGEYKDAETALLAVQAMNKQQDRHNDVIQMRNLAQLYQATGRRREALEKHLEAMRNEQAMLRSVFAFAAEASMHAALHDVSRSLDRLESMVALSGPIDPEAATHAFTWTLRRKGIVLDTLCRFRSTQRTLAGNKELRDQVERWRALRQQIADLALHSQGMTAAQLQKRVADSTAEAERLETAINRAAAKEIGTVEDVDGERVRAALPSGAALIELVRIQEFAFRSVRNQPTWKPAHYLAFILSADKTAKVKLVDLGLAAPIDDAIRKLRDEIQKVPREISVTSEKDLEADFAKVSGEVHRLVFAPVQKQLGKETLLFIAPDGELNRLPFEALVDERGKYLVERYRIAYLASGRDLLRPKASPAQGTVVFAGPDYDLKSKDRATQAEKLKVKVPADAVAVRGATPELRGLRWKPLRGAAAEARDVILALHEGEYGPVRAYRGAEALEEALKAMKPPRVLHLATHGFFLPDEQKKEEGDEAPEVGAAAGMARLRRFSNPLLRSGIVLAGANALGEEGATGEDGWVTAEEISLLDLRGTELVVLSACESGLGDVKAGEGVFGLRRAFLYAGARTLLNSLFEVPDTQTREMMKGFYGGMKAGKGKLESLHAAQLEMIRRRRQEQQAAHPFFWASFVLVGDPK
jgi:CHAT domain-containing protein